MVTRHRVDRDAAVAMLRASPTLLGPEESREFQAGVFLLLMWRGLRVRTAALLAEVEAPDAEAMMTRLRDNGIYRKGKWYGDWFNKETGTVEFVMTVLVALGIVVRLPAEATAAVKVETVRRA